MEGRCSLPKEKPLKVRSRSMAEMVLLIGPVPVTRDSMVTTNELLSVRTRDVPLPVYLLGGVDVLFGRIGNLH